MTPLALKIARSLLDRKSDPAMRDFARKLLPATHFEVTGVMDVVRNLAKDPIKNIGDEDTYFLPSDSFWFEHRNLALVKAEPINIISGSLITNFKWPKFTNQYAIFEHNILQVEPMITTHDIDSTDWEKDQESFILRNLLKLINHPRVINQQSFNPHAGLQKKLIAAKAMTGKFPLKAWTNLTLKCGEPPEDKSGIAPKKTILSGSRCQHWVISHRRVIGGVERIVKGHWRGDPSLGIKRSRYILE